MHRPTHCSKTERRPKEAVPARFHPAKKASNVSHFDPVVAGPSQPPQIVTDLGMSPVLALGNHHCSRYIVRFNLDWRRLLFLFWFVGSRRDGGRHYRSIERETSEVGDAPLELLYTE